MLGFELFLVRKLLVIFIQVMLIASFGACSNEAEFNTVSEGKSSSKGSKDGQDTSVDAQGESPPENSSELPPSDSSDASPKTAGADCGENGMTTASLLSESVENGVSGNFIEYEVAVTDCEGNNSMFLTGEILFDIDAVRVPANGGRPWVYYIKETSGTELYTGGLKENTGSDLFGNEGPDRYHKKTVQQVELSPDKSKVIFRIELDGDFFYESGAGRVASESSDGFQLDTFLKYGKAAPVKVPVSFVKGKVEGTLPIDTLSQ